TKVKIRRMLRPEFLPRVADIGIEHDGGGPSIGASESYVLDFGWRLTYLSATGGPAHCVTQRRRIEEHSPRNAVPPERHCLSIHQYCGRKRNPPLALRCNRFRRELLPRGLHSRRRRRCQRD